MFVVLIFMTYIPTFISRCRHVAFFVLICISVISCEKEINISLGDEKNSVVVEGYISDFDPRLNYIFITNSFSFQNNNFTFEGIKQAEVYITEGRSTGSDTAWNQASRKKLFMIDSIPGLYFDLDAYINPVNSIQGKQGYLYKLEINLSDGRQVSGITSIPNRVNIDSIHQEKVLPADTAYRFSVHFNDPEVRGNHYRAAFLRGSGGLGGLIPDSLPPLWGGFEDRFDAIYNDEVVNGTSRRISYGTQFTYRDTLHYYLNTMDRASYNFWLSVSNAKNNGGPFATPVILASTLTGAIGCFTGYSVSYRKILFNP